MVLNTQQGALDVISIQKRFQEFLTEFRVGEEFVYKKRINEMVANHERSVVVEFEHLIDFDYELAKTIQEFPDYAMPALKKALLEALKMIDPEYAAEIYEYAVRNQQLRGVETFEEAASLIPLNVRFKLPQSSLIRLRDLGAQHVDRLVLVEGVALRVAVSKPFLVIPVYRCMRCGFVQTGIVGLTEVFAPTKCPRVSEEGQRCNGPMALDSSSSYSINHQRMLLQERQEELVGGVLPRGVQALLTDDLVDKVKPGSRVRVSAIYRAYKPVKAQGERALDTFLEVNYLESAEKEFESVELTEKDLEEIRRMAQDPWLKEKLIDSLAPGIYGLRDIKEAILLALFGAPAVVLPDNTRVRGDSHILIIGDPGTGKSQLLQTIAKLVPRGIYTSGKGSSGVGLTAAVVRDAKGEFMLEAGAMVLADGGVCLIDEIDKMDDNDRSAIHEALEQQTVTITKAGIHATLNARCGVIAAGNPTFGKYLRDRSVADNINLPPTILSRFDLIFIVEDKPDDTRDRELADFVLRVRGQGKVDVPFSAETIRKYIAHARRSVNPVLSPDAAEKLNGFYLEMRKKSDTPDSPVVITTRQLEGLVRLTKAHARMRLSGVAEAIDAEAAIRLYNVFLESIGVQTSSGKKVDLSTVTVGKTSEELDTMAKIDKILVEMLALAGANGVLEADFRIRCKEEGFSEKDIEKYLKLKKAGGVLFEPKPGRIAKVKS
ncbi:hypothetical protein B9Q13_05645 [Candidatus Marsarchaeota G2 archaeon ECH_B_SAG-G16]|uniref:DNA helicase n=5 Tax=Candidatus Marsarchaeota TaxID=1978152 RepID=A0A2R6ABZ8_9ARCH|nr:MAG: hypothetical protein B9Q01_02810 [Candidatus Marsarchaeota G1 archaeon OSP_D]PSN88401.1 MAG: hypothetical protein B9Q00_05510 [Candidatus Marsarchaeota G1 archaeon OSP_C]PSO04092.1 MAG: hypothetical protein B9Q13_05645 [Candidatus Marsarchaeota G2 archaeon ECH_B_SAG-G16]